MLLTNRGIVEILEMITKPFVWIWHGIVNAATRGFDGFVDDFYDEEDDEEYLEEEDEEEEEEEAPDLIEKATKYIRGSRRPQPALPPAEDAPAEEEQLKTPRRRRREDEQQMKEVAFILGSENEPAPAPPKREELHNIDVDVPIFDHSDSKQPETASNRLTQTHQSGVEHIKSTLDEDEQFEAMVEKAAQ